MSIVEQVETLILPLVEANKMELVDVQFATEHGQKILRVFLDKEGVPVMPMLYKVYGYVYSTDGGSPSCFGQIILP